MMPNQFVVSSGPFEHVTLASLPHQPYRQAIGWCLVRNVTFASTDIYLLHSTTDPHSPTHSSIVTGREINTYMYV